MKKRLFIAILTLLLIIFLFFLILKKENYKKAENIESLVERQDKITNNLKIDGYTFENPNIIINPYEISPLTALVIFKTEENVEIKVTIKGIDELSTFTHTFEKGREHYLPIYGLYADYNNEILMEYDLNGEHKSKIINIKTDKLDNNIELAEVVNKKSEKLTNDLYFYTPSSRGYTVAYDVNGSVRWYLKINAVWEINRLKNGHLLLSTERLINLPYYMTGLYEMDMLGKVYTEYSLEGGYHHDYFELPSGNILVATDDFNNKYGTVEDVIVELDRNTGKIVKKYDLKDILPMEDGQSENWTSYDWFHNNSVWYDLKTNSITLSGRHQDAVVNIDYETGKLNWILGDSTNWSKEYKKYFFTPISDDFEWQWSQHAAMITKEGYVFLLDNGNNKSKNKEEYISASNSYTRGVMYKIDTDNMTIMQVWQYGKERGSSFYSPYISDVDYIDKNHYIVHSGGIVYVNGINSNQPAGFSKNATLLSDTVELINDEVVFELKINTNNYRVEKMSLYPNYNEFSTKLSKRLGTLGKTKVTKENVAFNLNSAEIDSNYEKHNISIEKEIDRLKITGHFKKSEKVNIILKKNMKAKYYEVKISKKPYTALCVDLFKEEENEDGLDITKYINGAGLKGKYDIYIEINSKIYNTDLYVEF